MACRRYKERGTGTVFGDNAYERTVPDGRILTAIALNLRRMVKALTGVNFRGGGGNSLSPGCSAPPKRHEGRKNRRDCFQN